MTQKASFYWRPANNFKKKQKAKKKTNQKNKTPIVLLPNRRSLLIPLALKVHSLLRCLLPSCDQNSQNPTRAA